MTFLKRHWPDLVISSLIVALLAGFALVFFNSETGRETQAERAPIESSATPVPPASQAGSPDTAGLPADGSDDQEPEELPTIPSGGGEAASPPETAPTEEAVTSAPDITPTPTPDRPDEVVPAPRESAPVATSRSGTPTRADYRLSAGVFNSEAVARERTASISALGYTVHFIAVEQGVVAQVGPFADRDSASRAAADIRRVFPGITLYSPVVRDDAQAQPASPAPSPVPAASSAPAQNEADAPSNRATVPTAASDTAPPASPSTPSGRSAPGVPVYLQVGAFDRQERAAGLVSRLRAEGIAAEVNAPPGRKVRVLVGPFAGESLLTIEDKLKSLGVDHFRVQ
ncbi:SPOR domain-containing protein [Deinococcus peraridilitoris]|uniref:Sporulation related protein n=1 Tax=Deinococcus peraridilitoris (strain DSM 19664 / LMG 22246 / CIP 109416 / KR-200) TaxID=937777 RepID=L0A703_DEIPD|nr:SPOR domain-containing protein [Deinococcus peraridilitoris]AFZ68972.1 sporulation related protein [Deinococcus peraridilitoris DSM 19664]